MTNEVFLANHPRIHILAKEDGEFLNGLHLATARGKPKIPAKCKAVCIWPSARVNHEGTPEASVSANFTTAARV